MRRIHAGLISLSVTATALAQAPSTSADAFAAQLKQAIDTHDRRAVAALVQYPITIIAGGFRMPFENAAAFAKSYDAFFTPVFRCRVSDAIANRDVTSSADGVSIAGSAIYAARKDGHLKITRMLVPSTPPPPPLPAPRQVAFEGRPAQFLGRLERDDYDRFILQATSGQRLDVAITGFPGRSADIRVLDHKSGAPVPTNLHVGPRTWSGIVPASGAYRVEIQRTAPYCDPAFQYQLTVTLSRR